MRARIGADPNENSHHPGFHRLHRDQHSGCGPPEPPPVPGVCVGGGPERRSARIPDSGVPPQGRRGRVGRRFGTPHRVFSSDSGPAAAQRMAGSIDHGDAALVSDCHCASEKSIRSFPPLWVGCGRLEATYEAVCCGKRVGLANKEVLVSGGQLVMEAVRNHSAELLPIDSEHNGAHQCLRAGQSRNQVLKTDPDGVRRSVPQPRRGKIWPT